MVLMTPMLITPSWAHEAEEALPAEAKAIIAAHEKKAAAIREKADKELAPHTAKAIEALKAQQDALCQQKKLDEALAVRNAIRVLMGISPNPGTVSAGPSDVGKVALYEVVGSVSGGLWGTEVYTTDSSLAAAAVHAGVLKAGEKGIVKVTIVKGLDAYVGSEKHGVTSASYGAWPTGFVVQPSGK
jgi:hypothetical protein